MFKGGYQIRDQHAIHFITMTVVQWVDVFTRKAYVDILLDSLKYCQENKNLKIHAWVVMSNHVHLVCSCEEPNKLSDTIRDLKRHTSKRIIEAIENNDKESRKGWMMWIFKSNGEHNKRNENYQFWQQGNHPIQCDTSDILQSRINYVHENPVRNGVVLKAEDYVYSSTKDYNHGEQIGLLDISFL